MWSIWSDSWVGLILPYDVPRSGIPAERFLPISQQPTQNLLEGGKSPIKVNQTQISDQMDHSVLGTRHALNMDEGGGEPCNIYRSNSLAYFWGTCYLPSINLGCDQKKVSSFPYLITWQLPLYSYMHAISVSTFSFSLLPLLSGFSQVLHTFIRVSLGTFTSAVTELH